MAEGVVAESPEMDERGEDMELGPSPAPQGEDDQLVVCPKERVRQPEETGEAGFETANPGGVKLASGEWWHS